jgi:probable selenium-dependent hydroxylase accessory protein YqeC
MVSRSKKHSFVQALGIQRGDVVCFAGAGGKTSLMFLLAQEARGQGLKVLVTTSTKILVPDGDQYDGLDLSGKLFSSDSVVAPGIYVGGLPTPVEGKMTGVGLDLLSCQRQHFDLVLIEADGAATKPLKGWNSTEPVIPLFATKTIGIVDIQTVGSIICEALVHRVEIFSEITGCQAGEPVSTDLLCRMILHDKGLFSRSQGAEILYINKVESEADCRNVDRLRAQLKNLTPTSGITTFMKCFLKNKKKIFKALKIVAGSVQQGTVYV